MAAGCLFMKKKIGIYIHIPFCIKKCDYCDFLSFPLPEYDAVMAEGGQAVTSQSLDAYFTALCGEIRQSREILEGYAADTVFVGGGTPSLLSGSQMQRLLEAVRDTVLVTDHAEISMEMNPEAARAFDIRGYRAAGVNRVSIGLQSACDRELALLGRVHTYRRFEETYAMLREHGFANINVDLMSALPGQSLADYAGTLQKVALLNPEHISAYSLIIEEGTPFYECYQGDKGSSLLPDEETDRQMYAYTSEFLGQRGYHRYEISNYAKEGYACRHNLKYWQMDEYIGFGLGSASYYGKKRYKNTERLSVYLDDGARWAAREETALTLEDEMEEYMFLGLRTVQGVCAQDFLDRFRVPLRTVYGSVIDRYVDMGFLEETPYLHLTERGLDVSNTIMADFLL